MEHHDKTLIFIALMQAIQLVFTGWAVDNIRSMRKEWERKND